MKLLTITRNCALVAVTIGLMTSCHIYKKFEMPTDRPLAGEYKEAVESTPDSLALGNLAWQEVFTDPLLQDFINRALENNKNLENARLNVEVARANVLGARLAYLPGVSLNPNGAGASYAGSQINWTYNVPVAISWEIDIFGKTLNNKRSAETALRMQQDYEQAVRSQIIVAVASCYYKIANLTAQIELSEQTAEIWKETVEVMKDYKEAGRVTQAAVAQSEAQYMGILGSIVDLKGQRGGAYNAMALLLNEMPQNFPSIKATVMEEPKIFRDGIHMRELAQRPDVRAAEEQLAIAYYTTNSARAAFYPNISISTNGGFTNLLGSFIKNPGDWFIQLAGQLTQPLFMRGQNIARLKGAKLQQEQALNKFEITLLTAAQEAGNNRNMYNDAVKKLGYLNEQVNSLKEAVEATTLLMAYSGSTTYLEVLTAQTNLLNAQMGVLNTQLTREQALINLYQSLGGGR